MKITSINPYREEIIEEFDQIVGMKHLFAFHVNDSMKECGCRVDRHANLGEGKIGLESFRCLMQLPQTAHLPKYLETPGGVKRWQKEIAMLHKFGSDHASEN